MNEQPQEVWILLVALGTALWMILHLAKELREQRSRAKTAEQKYEAVMAGQEAQAPDVHVFDPPQGKRFTEMDDWLAEHEGVNPIRERGEK